MSMTLTFCKETCKHKILIIDDNLLSKNILEDILNTNGFETRYALTGEDGLKIVEEWHPTVILLDIVMPGMDGIKVSAAVRNMQLPARPSIIIVSIKSEKAIIAEALAAGADDFIIKPVNDLELLGRVNAQIRIHEFYKEVEEDKRNLNVILDITTSVSQSLEPTEVLKTIVTKVAEATNAVRCSIVLIVKEDEGYVLASHEDPSVRELRLDLTKYPEIREVINTKVPLIMEDAVNHPIMSGIKKNIEDLKYLKDASMLILPIVFNDEVLGTLFLRSRMRETGFSVKEVHFCQIMANASFHALKNARLFEKVSKEREYLRDVSVKDQLTMLYNHNFFYSRIEEEFERAVRYEMPLSIIMMDIDNFKLVNDTYGHRMGDMVLKEISDVIRLGVRKTDVVARYGGEEFAVILPHTPLNGAVEEAERLRSLVDRHAFAALTKNKVTMSLGVASYPNSDVINSGDLVNVADDALYKAKWSGKNCVRVGGPGK